MSTKKQRARFVQVLLLQLWPLFPFLLLFAMESELLICQGTNQVEYGEVGALYPSHHIC
jgi:hypothetical protein